LVLKSLNEKISVIVPIYNVEKYLPKCIESIIKQTYTNLEIILVDDGSPDNCGKICDEYAERDKRIRVIHKENGGVSSARNCGIDNANGRYVTFIDADDIVEKDYIEYLYKGFEKDIDLVYTSFNLVDYKSNKIIENSEIYYENECTININEEYNIEGVNKHYSALGALYKKEKLDGLYFDTDLFVGEDVLFYLRYIKKCKKIKYLPEKKYNYIIYPSSACHGGFSEKKYTEIAAWKTIVELFKDMPYTQKSCRSGLAHACYIMYVLMYNSKINDKEKINELLVTLKENYKYMYDFDYSKSEILKIRLLLFSKTLFNVIFSAYKKIHRF